MVALVFGPATGHTATRYAVPGGAASGSCTTVADNCSGSAVDAAVSGDTVLVRAGTHTLSGRVTTPTGVTIEGQAGPRPLVQGPDPGPGYGLVDLQGPGTVLSHLDLRFTGASARPLVTLQGGTGGLLHDMVITNPGTKLGRRALRRQHRQLSRRAPIKRLSRRKGKEALSRTGVGPGAVKTRFSGRLGTIALKPAPYRSEIRATDATGNESAPKRLSFTVVKRR